MNLMQDIHLDVVQRRLSVATPKIFPVSSPFFLFFRFFSC
jgi:hypothetical protein